MKIRWKRSTGDYVESHCGRWWITPIYGGLTRPERYQLMRHASTRVLPEIPVWKVVASGSTQHECKVEAQQFIDHEDRG